MRENRFCFRGVMFLLSASKTRSEFVAFHSLNKRKRGARGVVVRVAANTNLMLIGTFSTHTMKISYCFCLCDAMPPWLTIPLMMQAFGAQIVGASFARLESRFEGEQVAAWISVFLSTPQEQDCGEEIGSDRIP
ncbi:uncharacterized protein LY89DRAFT_246633 [Mollisia scopiformis]|uniref:Uncharacterized protein n=1 Tax=Mollisia scopiformis TaxID=149040 RepID=A0A194WSM5_MOLSC|nr:uncharacterized protein LY89DRAFT_246633 [Mollisia scopiformis]KUJ10617.1 hypothetical protein LY89DRAFT_246633 [Mollisia scopiformis]